MKHSIVLQAPPICLATIQPKPNPLRLTQPLSQWPLKVSIKVPVRKKIFWPLASTIKPIMEQGGWAVSRSPLPSRLSDQNKQWVSVFLVGTVVGASFKATPPLHSTHFHADYSRRSNTGKGKGGVVTFKNIALILNVAWASVYFALKEKADN